jgi:hypothetical protein
MRLHRASLPPYRDPCKDLRRNADFAAKPQHCPGIATRRPEPGWLATLTGPVFPDLSSPLRERRPLVSMFSLPCLFNRHQPDRSDPETEDHKNFGICRHCGKPITRVSHRLWQARKTG